MYNKITLIGNLGQKPELQYTKSGTPVCNLNLAVNETWLDRNSGERRQTTTWFHVSVWGSSAESCAKYLDKGRQVFVEGTMLPASAYLTREGQAAASLEVRAQNVRFLGNGNGNASDETHDIDATGEDIPF